MNKRSITSVVMLFLPHVTTCCYMAVSDSLTAERNLYWGSSWDILMCVLEMDRM